MQKLLASSGGLEAFATPSRLKSCKCPLLGWLHIAVNEQIESSSKPFTASPVRESALWGVKVLQQSQHDNILHLRFLEKQRLHSSAKNRADRDLPSICPPLFPLCLQQCRFALQRPAWPLLNTSLAFLNGTLTFWMANLALQIPIWHFWDAYLVLELPAWLI